MMSKIKQVVDRTSKVSWSLVEVRIIELAAVDKTCSHNQDSIEICWIWILLDADIDADINADADIMLCRELCLIMLF